MSLIYKLPERARGRLYYALMALFVVIAIGTIGFYAIEELTLAESLYLTVTTVATVGYGDLHPRTVGGRAFATGFMLLSLGAVGILLSTAVQALVQVELIATFGARRRSRELNKLKDHYIICGAGRVGSRIIRDVQRAGESLIVIESNGLKIPDLTDRGVAVLVRDATLEETLREAGVERARGLAACLPDDADNVYVVLTARGLNERLHIVARAVEEQAEPKLIRAGANRVIAPTIIGSQRMTQALLKPAVDDFMSSITAENLDLNFEEVEIGPDSAYLGQKLRATNIRSELDVVIVAVRRRGGEMIFNPTGEATIISGDLMIAIGRADALRQLKHLSRHKK
ncbi:MAG: potassium channel family protein [Pyrinomonadaceae bacterium]